METLGQPLWIGQYRLTSRIATGGMAEVYVGRHVTEDGQFGPMVAVKRLLPHLVKDSGIVRMFLNEARITSQISHPNVVTIYELGQVDSEPFIAMELLEGHTFADVRNQAAEQGKRVPLGVALRVLCDACQGLDAAHRATDDDGQPVELVHRDFTPDNIHVGNSGEVKVIDFGIAKTASWGAGTEPGTLKGKFFYMSPEMILAKPVDRRADLFAAGVMLYEQLCGRRPFTGKSVDEVVMKIARGELQPPSSFDPSIPPAIEAVVLKALKRDPAQRFPSLKEFVQAIELVGGSAQVATNEEVAAYLVSLFPPSTDSRGQTLRRARENDPSVPGQRATGIPREPASATDPQPVPAHVPQGPDFTAPPVVPPPAAPPPVETATPGPPASKTPLLIGVAALVAIALGGFLLFGQRQSAAELMTEATAAKSAEVRASAAEKLAKAQDVTAEQLASIAATLAAEKSWSALEAVAARWVALDGTSFEARLTEARAAIGTRKGKTAETALAAALALNDKDPRPDAMLAELKELQADAAGALAAWAAASKKDPRSAHYLTRQGFWLSQSGRLDEASEVLTTALRRGFDAPAAAELGFVKFRKEQFDESLKLLRRAVRENPSLPSAQYYLGAVLYRKGDAAGAREAYAAASALWATDSRALTAWCEMEAQLGSPELSNVKKTIEKNFPKDAASLIARCTASAPTDPER